MKGSNGIKGRWKAEGEKRLLCGQPVCEEVGWAPVASQ